WRRYERGKKEGGLLLIGFCLGPKLQLLLKTGDSHRLLVGGSDDGYVIVGIFMRWDDVFVFDPRPLKDHGCLILEEQRQGLVGIKGNEPLIKVSFGYPFLQFGKRFNDLWRIVGCLKGKKLVVHGRPGEVFDEEVGGSHRHPAELSSAGNRNDS